VDSGVEVTRKAPLHDTIGRDDEVNRVACVHLANVHAEAIVRARDVAPRAHVVKD